MQITLNQPELFGEEATNALYGGNILATHGSMMGEGSYGTAINDMGVTDLRYPGGSLTEYYFDIKHPDAAIATNAVTGEQTNFIPISEFMTCAANEGQEVDIVIPTRDQLSVETDANGNRLPGVDEAALRNFVHDVVTGTYGNAHVTDFELGNEYWGSGEMNSVEYGRLAAKMSTVIKDELNSISESSNIDTTSTQVLVQMGENYGHSHLSAEYQGWDSQDTIDDLLLKYPNSDISSDNINGNGQVNWAEVNNELVQMNFDTPEEKGAIDGIIAHVYSRGAENDNSKFYNLDTIDHTWLQDAGFENLDVHVTEWNQKATNELDPSKNYGLVQSHEMLNIMESLMAHGVSAADVWPLIQNTSSTLSEGMNYSGKTVAGEMFTMMSENIPGKTMMDFTPGGDRETQIESQDVHIHGFVGHNDATFYIASVADQESVTNVDFSELIQSFDTMGIKILGVASGQNPGDTRSQADVQTVNSDTAFKDGILTANLDPREIMQVVIHNFEPTDTFAEALPMTNDSTANPDTPIEGIANPDTHDDLPDISYSNDVADNGDTVNQDLPNQDTPVTDDSGGGMGFAAGLLPILALFAFI